MKLITKNTDYAVRALIYISRSGKRIVPASELIDALVVPRPFLRKILQILNKKGVLKSYKGKSGGFELARAAEEISLVDLIEIFQGQFTLAECLFRRKICPNTGTCALRNSLSVVEEKVVEQLKPITVKSLASFNGR